MQAMSKLRNESTKLFAAYAAIYVIWGSSYLAIRVALQAFPPFLLAGVRFATAGLILYAIARWQGAATPSRTEWRSASYLGALLFLASYGALFWAETQVVSGLAAVLYATMQIFVLLIEIAITRTQRMTLPLLAGSLTGFAGVLVLSLGGRPSGTSTPLGITLVLIAAILWAVGAVWSKRLDLPKSKSMSAATQMITGGAMLLIPAFALGDVHRVHWSSLTLPPLAALLFLITFASLMAFTSYVWLIHRQPVSKVASYAYVNPVIAMFVGHFLAAEPLTIRMLGGTALIIISVVLVTARTTPNSAVQAEELRLGQRVCVD
jgi:drug/metabolite transporter (DMT)-like permease